MYKILVKNITLSAEDRLIEAARKKASEHFSTLNEMFRTWLVHYVQSPENESSYQQLMENLTHVKVRKTFTRDELNER